MYREVEFTREELFAKVWVTPVLRLAKEIGVSDVALGKACRRAAIPLPPRGHWAIPEGRRSARPKLPAAPSDHPGVVRFTVLGADQKPPSPPRPSIDEAPIRVECELTAPHALVAKTQKTLKSLKPQDGRLHPPREAALDVGVSPTQMDRVLRMLDALIKACEQKGWRWGVGKEGTLIHCNGEQIQIRVWEVLTKQTIPPEPRRTRQISGYSSSWDYPRYEWVSSGRVSVLIESGVANSARRKWASTPHSPLEDKLHEIVAGLPLVAEGIRLLRAEREAWKRNWDEEQARRKEAARMSEIQRRLRARLVKSLEDWERSNRLLRLCEAARVRIGELTGEDRERAEVWLAWALDRARELDPLGERLEITTDPDVELEHWYYNEYQQRPEDWWSKLNG